MRSEWPAAAPTAFVVSPRPRMRIPYLVLGIFPGVRLPVVYAEAGLICRR